MSRDPLTTAPAEAPTPAEVTAATEISDTPTSPDVLERIQNNIYACNSSAQNQKADLHSLQALDKECEIQIAKWGGRLVLYILGAFLLGAIGFISVMGGADSKISWLVYLGLLLFIPIIPFGVLAHQAWTKKKSFERYEYPDYRYLTCLRLVELLGTDMDSNSPLNTTLLLRSNPILAPPKPAPTLPPVLETDNEDGLPPVLNQNEGDLPPVLDQPASATIPPSDSGKRGNVQWMSQSTIDQWLHLTGQLRDGTKFDFSVSENSEDYGEHFRYRTVRGKTKTKLRARKRLQWLVSLTLRFKEKRYTADATEKAHFTELIQLPQGAKLKKLDVRGNEFRITAVSPTKKLKAKHKGSSDINGAWKNMCASNEDWEPISELAALTFLNVYQILNGNKKA